MNVLYLCQEGKTPLMRILSGDNIIATPDMLTESDLDWAEFIVSYNYRYILSQSICERFKGRLINIHIALLPWNRGAHPNVWSAVEKTPSGVTLHYVDSGIDTGDIIEQVEVPFSPLDTLRSSHAILDIAALALFEVMWPSVRNGKVRSKKQEGKGSYHRRSDLDKVYLPNGWDTLRKHVRYKETECL